MAYALYSRFRKTPRLQVDAMPRSARPLHPPPRRLAHRPSMLISRSVPSIFRVWQQARRGACVPRQRRAGDTQGMIPSEECPFLVWWIYCTHLFFARFGIHWFFGLLGAETWNETAMPSSHNINILDEKLKSSLQILPNPTRKH